MKHLILLILTLMMLPLTASAQARTGGQRTENYPTVVNGHLAFMGIPINTAEASLRKQLFAKGFKVYKNRWGQEFPETLVGIYKGRKVQVQTMYKGLIVQDDEHPTLEKARKRYYSLVKQLESIYGKGVTKDHNDFNLRYEIKTPQGLVVAEMFNEDEMEGESDSYIVSFVLSESEYND